MDGEGPELKAGERIVLIDNRQRRYLVELKAGGEFHSHAGVVPHDEIIGSPEGSEYRTASNARFVGLRPTLSDHVLKMPRGAQVIYPKDLGPILMLADVSPKQRVLESGVGSGALSTTLLRAGAYVTGYEIREDFAETAKSNVEKFLGPDAMGHYDVKIQDAYQPHVDVGFDRAVLDLPEPWQVVPHLETSLRSGGILVAYNPSIIQVQNLRKRLSEGPWALTETVEVLNRTWHVEGNSVRPDHRMVAHTGFLTHARLIEA
ncbi:MAG: tRNA (adenine-N1)-methyltransferase [Acidimicrobiales bacterium]|jgi:tRNA (adenine57-N1/adenine58-N1)-methyltransferase|nr:tRNA (adenine-N1)-methyltransferase [Acidimicrobiales bacterium]MDP6901244.1 tRNA (adenine-N1)-methyltransferase [Acidimicrobiales bacterium]